MRMYLRLVADHTKYTDKGEYDTQPFDAPAGFEWVEGELPEGATKYEEPTLLDRLTAIFTSLDVTLQADLGPLAAAVFTFLEKNNPEAAKQVIIRATIPPELEPLRTQMLEVFP